MPHSIRVFSYHARSHPAPTPTRLRRAREVAFSWYDRRLLANASRAREERISGHCPPESGIWHKQYVYEGPSGPSRCHSPSLSSGQSHLTKACSRPCLKSLATYTSLYKNPLLLVYLDTRLITRRSNSKGCQNVFLFSRPCALSEICPVCISLGAMAVQDHILDHVLYQLGRALYCIMDIHKVRFFLSRPPRYLHTDRIFSHRGQESLQKHEHDSRRRSRSLKRYIFFCLGCVCVSTTIVVMEAYALLALQFCDGEDLMSLYWSTWTMIQIGSLIAMVGIILALLHSLQNSQHP